jgi:hypothetical protein
VKGRRLELVGMIVATIAVIALLRITPVPAVGSEAAGKAVSLSIAKTPWGEADLQGIWTDEYQTPLQRPARYAGKELFTDEERADLDKRRAAIPRRDYRAQRGTEQDVAGAYNAVFQSVKPTGRRTSLIVDPPDGRLPPLTTEAKGRNAVEREFSLALLQATQTCKTQEPECAGWKYGPPSPKRTEVPPFYSTLNLNRSNNPEDRAMGERCMAATLPDFGGYRRIVQSPGSVSIFYDVGQGQGWSRTLLMTGNPHLPPNVRQWWGDSRGRWEGNTLVVDVTNFSPKANFRGAREHLHLVERWTRLNANTLEYVVTVEDPTTWMRPWTVKQELTKQSDQANRIYYEPRCHEGNYGLVALLSGGRADDLAFAKGLGPDPATKDTTKVEFGGGDENTDPLLR